MKTSEEMARSVMTRAKAKRSAQKRNLFTTTAALLCVCGLSVGAWLSGGIQMKPINQGSNQTEPMAELQPLRLSLLAYAAEAEGVVIMEDGIKVPGQQQIRVLDLRGMTEAEAQTAMEKEKEHADAMLQQNQKPGEDNLWICNAGKNAMVIVISAGCLHVPIDDADLVENVRVSVDGDGKMFHIETFGETEQGVDPKEYIAEGAQLVEEWKSCGGVNMIWMPSEEKKWELANDPTIPLASITSTITTMVNMKDGTRLRSVVDVTVDDSGLVYFTSRGETTT